MNVTPRSVMARAKSVFSEKKPYPGMHAVGAAALDDLEDLVGVQIALGRGLTAERIRLIGQPDVQCFPVEL